MWSPTHINVTVISARNLLCKGKNNTNNCFVTIALGKEKYQTSVIEKAPSKVEWKEECELKIPDQGNRAELVLTCLHRNNLGIDEFLGQVTLPLNEMDAYASSKVKWYKLESKPGKEKKNKERGELEVKISFTVKSGSLTDLSKKEKHKSSIGQLASSVGGSLLSISTIEKRKGIKKIAKKFGSKLHLSGSGKKKNKDDDDMSYTGSFASIGTPNRVRVADSDDEYDDDVQFEKLSQKSWVSSRDGLHPPGQNYTPGNPSPLMGSTGKGQIGKDHHFRFDGSDNLSVDPELEEIENEFSIRARTLPAPSKPPRTPQMDGGEMKINGKDKQNTELDEWESKLYGRSADSGNSDSLKRRPWEPVAVPLKNTSYENEQVEEKEKSLPITETEPMTKSLLPTLPESQTVDNFSNSSSSSDDEEEIKKDEKPKQVVAPLRQESEEKPTKPTELKFESNNEMIKKDSLLSPADDKNEFAKFNASFAKFEQRNSSKFFDIGDETNNFLKNESQSSGVPQPQPKPRARIIPTVEKSDEETKRQRAAEDARLEAELQANEKRLKEEEEALQKELRQKEDEEKRREAKRREEDLRILNFSKRLVAQEDKSDKKKEEKITEPPTLINNKDKYEEEKKQQEINNKKERQFNFQNNNNYNNREKENNSNASTPSPKQTERIIIGHEKATTQAERRAEISAALAKKYEGKSREELMLIANGMENEALIQRQRVKELEDYLDNLLLRVMETHPKILQNPYSRTTSAKSG
ncbi:rab11 interacting protein isoform 2-T2 [Cochliomyia hominivorax]